MISERIERGKNEDMARLTRNMVLLGHSAARASVATKGLSVSLYDMAERGYIANHKRLPGSNKTKRLQKKRRDRVFSWLFNDIASWATQENATQGVTGRARDMVKGRSTNFNSEEL